MWRTLKNNHESITAIGAILISGIALFVAWDQARIMRVETRAAVWPALQVDAFTSRDSDAVSAGFRVKNAGVGPAIIKSVTVRYGGRALADYDAMGEHLPDGYDLSYERLVGRILAAGEDALPMNFIYPTEDGAGLIEALSAQGDQWTMEVCYCSALGQCWIRRTRQTQPEDARQCAAGQSGDF